MSSDPSPFTPPPAPDIPSNQDERTLAMLCHLGGILNILVPLIIWLVKKDQSQFINDQGKEAVNFQIMVTIALIISGITCLIVVGFVLVPAVIIANIVFCIMAGMEANRGKVYRYPFGLRLIK